MQALVQKYVTHSISSTINLPSDVSVDSVGGIYLESWKKGLKGITVYRDGLRSGVLVSSEEGEEDSSDEEAGSNGIDGYHPPKRPKKIEADVIRFQNEYEKWLAVVGFVNGKPYEIFTGKMEDSVYLPSFVINGWRSEEHTSELQSCGHIV